MTGPAEIALTSFESCLGLCAAKEWIWMGFIPKVMKACPQIGNYLVLQSSEGDVPPATHALKGCVEIQTLAAGLQPVIDTLNSRGKPNHEYSANCQSTTTQMLNQQLPIRDPIRKPQKWSKQYLAMRSVGFYPRRLSSQTHSLAQ